jgi:arsenate reductase
MRKIYHLGTCSTCARIIGELGLKQKKFKFQDIRTEKITPAQLKEMKDMAGSYDALFSRVALKYRAMKLNERTLSEDEMKDLILQEDTFLKRPVIIIGNSIFIGNSKKNLEAVKERLI